MSSSVSSNATISAGTHEGEAVFSTQHGAVTTANPLVKAVIEIPAGIFPSRLSATELTEEIRRRHPDLAANLGEQFLAVLLHAAMSGVVEIHSRRAPFTTTISDKPLASPLARYQLVRNESIATLDHRTIEIADESARRILPLLDGTHGISEIAAALNLEESPLREKLRTFAAQALLMEK